MFTMHTCEQVQKDARAAGIKDVISKSDAIGNHLLASLSNNLRSAFTSHQHPRNTGSVEVKTFGKRRRV